MFDTKTKAEVGVYPPKPPDRVRTGFVERVRERWVQRGEAWFREHNHHFDPELFDNNIGDILIDWNAKAVAFSVHYRDEYYDEHRRELVSRIEQHVIVTRDGFSAVSTIKCRETPLEAWRELYSDENADAIVKRAATEPRKVVWR